MTTCRCSAGSCLRARCRDCGAPISWRYPAVELAVGLWFAIITLLTHRASLVGLYVQLSSEQTAFLLLNGIGLAVLGFLLLGLIVMDWQTHLLPDAFTLSGTLAGFLLVCVEAIFLPYGAGDIKLHPRNSLRLSSPGSFAAKGNVFLTGTESIVFGRLAAIVGAALVLLCVRWLYFALRGRKRLPHGDELQPGESDGRYGLGLGDVKLLAMIAAFLGFWPAILALFVGVVACSLYAAGLLATRRATALSPRASRQLPRLWWFGRRPVRSVLDRLVSRLALAPRGPLLLQALHLALFSPDFRGCRTQGFELPCPHVPFGVRPAIRLRSCAVRCAPPAAPSPERHSRQSSPERTPLSHHTSGSFEPGVKPLPADVPETPTLGRFVLTKVLHGGIEATGAGQMLTAMTPTKGSAAYVAVELITGKVDGHSGSFALVHKGLMNRGEQSLVITVVPDSGTGELVGLAGTLTVHIAPDGKHTYDFDYTLPDGL